MFGSLCLPGQVSQRFAKPDQPSVLFAPYMGQKDANGAARVLGIEPSRAVSLEKARIEASKVLV